MSSHRAVATVVLAIVGLTCFLIVGAVASMTASRAVADAGVGRWHMTGSQLGGHPDERVAGLANGRVLVMYAEDEEVTPTHPAFTEQLGTELYEPGTGTWVPGPKPPARNATTIVPLTGGGALLLGEAACDGSEIRCLPTSATYLLNSSDSEWAPSAPMLQPRVRPTVVPLADGRVLVAGGFGDSCTPRVAFGYSCAPLSSVEIFDPAAGAWAPAAPMPTPRGGAGATLLSDGTVLLVGGGNHTEDALRYSPASDRWTSLGPPPSALTGSRLLSLPGDRVIALGVELEAGFFGSYGGAGARSRVICDSIPELYSAAHNTWGVAPPLPGEPISCSTNAVRLTNGHILYSENDRRYVLDPRQRCWAATGAPVTERYGLLTALSSGDALAPGRAVNEGEPFTGAEIYTPGPQTCSVAQRIQTSVFAHLAPEGTAAKLPVILSAGYSFSLRTIRAGSLRVEWYFMRKESEGRPGPVLVGAGRAHSTGAGPVKLTLRLTAAGRKLINRSSSSLQMTANGTFATKRGNTVTATRPLTLSR